MPHDKLQFEGYKFILTLPHPFENIQTEKRETKMQHQLQSLKQSFNTTLKNQKSHSKNNHLILSYSIRQTMSNTQTAKLCKFSNLTFPPPLRCRELKVQDNLVCRTAKAIWAMTTHPM